MTRLRFLTAGESHGPALTGILEGLPSGLRVTEEDVAVQLQRRQKGFGRSARMKIENDRAQILSGVRFGKTLGSPVALLLPNQDFASWKDRMSISPAAFDERPLAVPRPGHADFAGALKYNHLGDLRGVLERASARETAMRVALASLARNLLREFGITVGSYVRSIGGVQGKEARDVFSHEPHIDAERLGHWADQTPTRALDEASSEAFVQRIEEARKRQDTVGGLFEVWATGVPVGLGSYVHADRRLDGRLAQGVLSIPAIKALELGDGLFGQAHFGSEVHDAFSVESGRVERTSNHAGGLEGGVTNGQPLILRAAMKPIATLSRPLPSFHVHTLEETAAHVERSDTCAVPAAAVIAESMVCLTLADALLEALGGDSMDALRLPFARLRLSARPNPGHLFLFGPMGSGKTSTGRLLSQQLGLPFVDLDTQLEKKANTSIASLFEKSGEAAFRALEEETLREEVARPPSVLSLGGGTALTDSAWQLLRTHGVVFGLSASPATLARRVSASGDRHRPILKGGDAEEALRRLVSEREAFYARADVTVDTEGRSVSETAAMVLGLWHFLKSNLGKAAR